MKERNVYFVLGLVLVVFAIIIIRLREKGGENDIFNRYPRLIYYTDHAICAMNCRKINKEDIGYLLEHGIVNLNRSELRRYPCPFIVLQGLVESGRGVRIALIQCKDSTTVTDCLMLRDTIDCSCK